MSHRWGSLAVLMFNFLIDHCLYGITRLILILSVRPGLSWMYNAECAPVLMPCMVFILCIYIFVNNIGKVSPYTVYWQSVPRQSVPMHFLLAICPHAFCIGNLSPCIFYWQSVPMNFLSFGIFSIVKHSSHTALGIFFFFSPFSFLPFLFFSFLPFLFSLFFSPFSFLPFLFSLFFSPFCVSFLPVLVTG